ncbi:MAG: MATE family efflux transporter [Oscillibacter sp.]|nr:MATE family efflux transporter [Oscillibacter sp.]
MREEQNLTEGPILRHLLRFALPVLLAVCLQDLYGAADLVIVARFGTAADVAAVSTGSQIMELLTLITAGLTTGTTVLLGRIVGRGEENRAGPVIGGGMYLFLAAGAAVTVVLTVCAGLVVSLMRVPAGIFRQTVTYVRICSAGFVCTVAYNFLGSVFRGMGNARVPLAAAALACIFNIAADLSFEHFFGQPVFSAACATVLAQAVSVGLCLLWAQRKKLPLRRRDVRFRRRIALQTLRLGAPVALQNALSGMAFMATLPIINTLGVTAAASVGAAEKLCTFAALVPMACAQSLSAFTAQNVGAGRYDRAHRALWMGMGIFLLADAAASWMLFFRGDGLIALFGKTAPAVTAGAWEYLRAHAVDLLLSSILFSFIGYFDGCGRTRFLLLQSIAGIAAVRIPVTLAMSRRWPVSLLYLGMAAPCATAVQILLCAFFFARACKTRREAAELPDGV